MSIMTIAILRNLHTCCKGFARVQGVQQLRKFVLEIQDLIMTPPIVYHTFESVLNVLENPQFKDTASVKSLMEIYKNVQSKSEIGQGEHKKHPLIVMEGLDGSGKTTTSRALANHIGAEIFSTPPPCLHEIRHLFDQDAYLRTAYYAMGNYIAALEISSKLRIKPVILDRYWHSTTAYAIAQAIKDNPMANMLPAKGDEIYHWPADLLKPDIVLLLSVSENVRLQRHAGRKVVTNQERLLKADSEFRGNVLEAYKNMWDPSIEIINADGTKKAVQNLLVEKIKGLLK